MCFCDAQKNSQNLALAYATASFLMAERPNASNQQKKNCTNIAHLSNSILQDLKRKRSELQNALLFFDYFPKTGKFV